MGFDQFFVVSTKYSETKSLGQCSCIGCGVSAVPGAAWEDTVPFFLGSHFTEVRGEHNSCNFFWFSCQSCYPSGAKAAAGGAFLSCRITGSAIEFSQRSEFSPFLARESSCKDGSTWKEIPLLCQPLWFSPWEVRAGKQQLFSFSCLWWFVFHFK